MKRAIFQLLLSIFIVVTGCTSESFNIPGSWSFTVIRKNQVYEIRSLNIPQDHTTVLIYYPEICGFCLSQIDAIKEELAEVEPEKKRSNIQLLCVINTIDIVTMQYYLDEKMDYCNEIYIDTEDNIGKAFFPEAILEYPYYFVIQGNSITEKNEINDDRSLSHLFSLFVN